MPELINNTEDLNLFYRKLLAQVPDLIFRVGLNGYDDDECRIFVSDAIEDTFEITAEEFKADPEMFLREIIFPEDKEALLKSIDHARTTLTPWNHEFRVQLPKKGLRWMRVNASTEESETGKICLFGRVTDITDKKDQESQLLISEGRYRYALKAASEGIWDWDLASNAIYFSAQSMKIIGKEEEELTVPLEYWVERIHPDDLKQYNAAKNAHLKGKTPFYECIYRVKTDSGNYRWVLSRGRAVQFDNKGKAIRCIGTHKDITQLKEKEIELGDTLTIIGNQNNRLLNFAHIVSHNLRSHAGNLKMLLDLFKSAEEDEKEQMLEHLEAISDGLYVTIGHLKELVEIQFEIKTVKEKLNLRHYLKNILTILHNEITKHGVNIEINIPLDVTVNYNPAYLESILLNFTTNAIKYSSSERKPMLSYDFEIIDGQKVLSISDNGLGIDLKKHKNSLFGMYKTFHKHQNSRGIGLFITKNQIEAMGGKIEVLSEVNKGTTFKIYFNEED
jgi:PAS domain S-box-containing protein